MSNSKSSFLREFLGYFLVIVLAIIFSISVRIFMFEPYIVPTPSMEPTLMVGDRVIVNKLAYKLSSIDRGDIVVFHSPLKKDLVKRVIAVEGDIVKLNVNGEIYINGKKLVEPYLLGNNSFTYEEQTFILSKDEIFVMGDNRSNSFDSRYFGPIRESEVFGSILVIYWPPSQWGKPNRG